MCGRPPMRPTGPWGTFGVETTSPVEPGARNLGTAVRMVPLAAAPCGSLESAVVPVSFDPRASGWNGGVVVLVLFAPGFASSSLFRNSPCGSFFDQYRRGPVLGYVFSNTATCAACSRHERGVEPGNVRPGLNARQNETRLAPMMGPPLPTVLCTALNVCACPIWYSLNTAHKSGYGVHPVCLDNTLKIIPRYGDWANDARLLLEEFKC
jgi:hypothetical protein